MARFSRFAMTALAPACAVLVGCQTASVSNALLDPRFEGTPTAPPEQPLLVLPVHVDIVKLGLDGSPHPQEEKSAAFGRNVRERSLCIPSRASS